MRKLLLLIAVVIFANNTRAQWQTNGPDKASTLNSSSAHSRQIQDPATGDKELMAENYAAASATYSNVHRRTGKHDGGVARSSAILVDSLYDWLLDDTTMTWDIYSKNINYVYNANNNPLSYVQQKWIGGAWVNYEQITNTYNSSGNYLTSALYQTWSGNAWVNSYLFSYTYNSSNDQTSELDQNWSGSAWVNNQQYTWTYNSSNDQIGEVDQNWSGNAWVNNQQYTWTYNSSNDPTSEVNQNWSGSAWVNNQQYTWTYNSSNDLTNQIDQTWNGSAWVNSMQYTPTYNSSNDLINELDQSWNGSAWVNSGQSTFTYDSNNDRTSELNQNWSGSAWVNSAQFTYGYNSNNVRMWSVEILYNSTGTAVTFGDSIVEYFNTTTGINNISAPSLSINIYPDPSTGYFTVSGLTSQQSVEIYDCEGQRIDSRIADKTTMDFNIADYASGVYLVRVQNQDGSMAAQMKMVKTQ